MAIIRVNPWGPISAMRQIWDEQNWPMVTLGEGGLDVWEEDNHIKVRAAVPGVPAEKVEVTYEDGVLTIDARVEEKSEEKDKNRLVHKMEMTKSFHFTTNLPRPVDPETLIATVKDGVLELSAAVSPAAKARKVVVKNN